MVEIISQDIVDEVLLIVYLHVALVGGMLLYPTCPPVGPGERYWQQKLGLRGAKQTPVQFFYF